MQKIKNGLYAFDHLKLVSATVHKTFFMFLINPMLLILLFLLFLAILLLYSIIMTLNLPYGIIDYGMLLWKLCNMCWKIVTFLLAIKTLLHFAKLAIMINFINPFAPSSNSIYSKSLDLVHSNLWAPTPITSSFGFSYYIHFIDSFSTFSWLYLLKHKSNAFQAFLYFKASVELQLSCKLLAIQSDYRVNSGPFPTTWPPTVFIIIKVDPIFMSRMTNQNENIKTLQKWDWPYWLILLCLWNTGMRIFPLLFIL